MVGRRRTRIPRLLLFVWSAILVCGVASAVTGVVKKADGDPANGAQVCFRQHGVDQICATTDEAGWFQLPDNEKIPIRILADGHYAETRPAVGHQEIVLRASPTLVVRLVDGATGDPIDGGELQVVYSAEKKVGPFPVNAAGVVIQRVLKPGEVRLIGTSEGYRSNESAGVKLENGKKTKVDLELEKLSAKPGS